jgi:C4-dicarboxylate transporter, DctQ subunit
MGLINKINNFVVRIETVILVVIVLVMVTLSFMQVVLRNVFDQGILWGDIFLRHLVLWVGFIGASLAAQEEKHINIDVLTRFMKGRSKLFSQGFIYFFATWICYLLLMAAWAFVRDEIAYDTMLFENVPSWYLQIIIPIGFALMAVRFALLGVQKWISGFTYKAEQAS